MIDVAAHWLVVNQVTCTYLVTGRKTKAGRKKLYVTRNRITTPFTFHRPKTFGRENVAMRSFGQCHQASSETISPLGLSTGEMFMGFTVGRRPLSCSPANLSTQRSDCVLQIFISGRNQQAARSDGPADPQFPFHDAVKKIRNVYSWASIHSVRTLSLEIHQ